MSATAPAFRDFGSGTSVTLQGAESIETASAARAREAVREVERFAYRILSDAETDGRVLEARSILRLAVGLRRKLDLWRK